jgi:hypothetical protein
MKDEATKTICIPVPGRQKVGNIIRTYIYDIYLSFTEILSGLYSRKFSTVRDFF